MKKWKWTKGRSETEKERAREIGISGEASDGPGKEERVRRGCRSVPTQWPIRP